MDKKKTYTAPVLMLIRFAPKLNDNEYNDEGESGLIGIGSGAIDAGMGQVGRYSDGPDDDEHSVPQNIWED